MQNIQKKLLWFGTIVAFSLLLYALWSQHIGGYEPCVRCIYQRMAMLGIGFGGIIALCHYWLRPIGLLIVFISAIFGVLEAHTHAGVMAGTINDFCPFRPDFGFLGRLDEIAPWFFGAFGDCADDSWKAFGFNMPQWMWFIYLSFATLSSLFLIYSLYDLWRVKFSSRA